MLEVGCNDGSNLIPMAVSLPAAQFVGCDLSAPAIEAGRRTIDIVELYVRPPAAAGRASDQPAASPLARLQARTRGNVTTLLHIAVGIADLNALRLLPLVDGTRDRAALADAVRNNVAMDIDPSRVASFVDFALEKYARLGLLVADAQGGAKTNTGRGG